MKKSILFLIVLVTGISTSAQAQFSGGDGSEGNPYQVATAADLNNVRNYLGSYFIQTADIDLDVAPFNTGSGWEPVGTNTSNFTGTFDGNGFTISNLYINRGSEFRIGLFGYTSGAAIKNTGLTNVDVTGGGATGGLVGYNYNGSIANSYAAGVVSSGGNYTGGLVGLNANSSTITNSYAAGTVSGGSYTGGLVGYSSSSAITNSYAAGTVSGVANTGGLAGTNYGSSTITNSYFTGTVSGEGNYYTGGLAGLNSNNSTITNSYSAGMVSGGSNTGGLVGGNLADATITNSYWDTETSGQAGSAGGTGLTTAQMKQQASFTGFDFNSTWQIDEDLSYPYLQNNVPASLPGNPFAGGAGTETNPLQIATAGQLDLVRDYPDKYFILTADIDLDVAPFNTGSGWEPVGTFSSAFTGTFDGNGFTISNLYINRGSEDNIGLFGYTNGAAIKNTGLTNVDVTGGAFTGGLVGYTDGGSTITNSYAAGTVSGGNSTGGLAGENDFSAITNSYAVGTVSGGGITGGLAGYNYEATITNSYAAATVSGDGYTGGLIGANYGSSAITNSYAAGMVSGGSDTGGLVGANCCSSTISNSYWNTETGGQAGSAGGTGLTTAQMKDSVNYAAGWDFVNTWSISQNAILPWLQETGSHRLGGPEITGSEGWRMMASPFGNASYGTLLDSFWTQGFTGSDSPGEGAPNAFTWSESGGWTALPDAANVPGAGTGFLVYVYDDQDYNGISDGFPKSLLIEGEEDTGSISPALSFTDTEDLPNDGWNLVGNPYGSSIEWGAAAGWTKTNLDASFYVWNNAAGEYQSHNGSAGTLDNDLIAPWQGFWVKANATSPAIAFTDDIRSNGGVFLKKAPVPQITFSLEGQDKSSSTVLMLSDEAILGKDPFDAWRLQSLNSEYLSLFTLLEDGTPLDINALPSGLAKVVSVDLDYDAVSASGGLFTAELKWDITAFPEDWKFELIDNHDGETISLNKTSTYVFDIANTSREAGASGGHSAAPEGTGELRNKEEQACLPLEGDRPGPCDRDRGRTVKAPSHGAISPRVIQAKAKSSGTAPRFTLSIIPGSAVSTEPGTELPSKVALAQNYPNPFNPSTVIRYQLPVNSEVTLEVFDMLGRKVATLVDGREKAGIHEITFNAQNLASGMYIYRLHTGNKTITKKLTLIK